MKNIELGMFIARVVLGLTFFLHGLDKFQSGLGNISAWFDSVGLPGFLAYFIAVIELIGGLAMILGIGTRVVGVLFAFVMLGAIFTVKSSAGFLGGFELDLILLVLSIQVALSGSTFISLDQAWIRSKETASL
jgi:uncharacterized membrane protein YphA (DoxX/SURF4 family)